MSLYFPGYTGTGGGFTTGGGLNLPDASTVGSGGGFTTGGGLNIPGMGQANINPALATATGGGASGLGAIAGGIGDIFGGLLGAGQQALSSPNALMGLAGGLLTKEAYDRLSNIGEQAKREAMGVAERGQAESQFRPFTVTTPTGAMFSTSMGGQQPAPTPMGADSPLFGMTPGQIQAAMPTGGIAGGITSGASPLGGQLIGGASPLAGMTPEQIQAAMTGGGLAGGITGGLPMPQPAAQPAAMPTPAGDGLQVSMQLSPQEQALQQQLLGGAGGFFGQAAQPTQAREQAVFERMRAAQRPEEQRQRLALEERLAAQGRLGTSSAAYGGATPELLALSTAEREARDRSMLTAMQQAQAEQAQQAALGGQFLGAGYLPQQQLIASTQPGLIQQELAQQAQQFGTGLFGETALSGIEAQLLAEQARANLLGGVGSNVISGLINQQRAASAAPSGSSGSGLGGLFSTIAGGLGGIGGGIADLLGIGG